MHGSADRVGIGLDRLARGLATFGLATPLIVDPPWSIPPTGRIDLVCGGIVLGGVQANLVVADCQNGRSHQ